MVEKKNCPRCPKKFFRLGNQKKEKGAGQLGGGKKNRLAEEPRKKRKKGMDMLRGGGKRKVEVFRLFEKKKGQFRIQELGKRGCWGKQSCATRGKGEKKGVNLN